MCIIVVHNTALNRSDNLPSYPPDSRNSSEWRQLEVGTIHLATTDKNNRRPKLMPWHDLVYSIHGPCYSVPHFNTGSYDRLAFSVLAFFWSQARPYADGELTSNRNTTEAITPIWESIRRVLMTMLNGYNDTAYV